MNTTVLDFGMGNLRSVAKALEKAGASVQVSSELPASGALVVPGQGHFGSCVANLGPRLDDVAQWINDDRPFLGICLGLQVLFPASEEAPVKGLGVIDGSVRRFSGGVKIPHIGWNEVQPAAGQPVFEGILPGTRFYFVHSYYPDPADESVIAATTEYGVRFCSAASRSNMVATQFHPEKSGEPGITLLRNFLRMAA
ncbi:MAG: imidazole glycerol phosphate synthase subunit HisH [Actinomycetota bacterium]